MQKKKKKKHLLYLSACSVSYSPNSFNEYNHTQYGIIACTITKGFPIPLPRLPQWSIKWSCLRTMGWSWSSLCHQLLLITIKCIYYVFTSIFDYQCYRLHQTDICYFMVVEDTYTKQSFNKCDNRLYSFASIT